MTTERKWQTICQKSDLVKRSGVCALLADQTQVAIFQIDEDKVCSVANWDPIGSANVLYRGIIGDKAGEFYVASPLYKQRFSLISGKCLDDENVEIATFESRILGDEVQLLVG